MFVVVISTLFQAVYSISRSLINKLLITKAEQHSNVKLNFNHKLQDIKIKDTQATFTRLDGSTSQECYDTIIR